VKAYQPVRADRSIYTYVGGSRVEFKTTTTAITTTLLGVTTDAARTKVIDFLRGVDTTDEDFDGDTAEDKAWKLGDIFHSSPVLVTPPFLPSPETSYQTFRAANATRAGVLLAGANDGMLHAFRETDGVELWAFIPPNILGRLKELVVTSGDHPFLVDGSPIAADIKISGAWKTVVLFGERRGGNSYHALDITDTTNPVYLWSFTDTKIAETWSEPVIGKVKMDNGSGGYTEKYVAFVGGGYNTSSNNTSGKAVFAVDMATGAKLWEYYNATGSSDDRQYMNYSIPANPLALDMNSDGFIDRLYIGDIGGQLWKFDLSANATLTGSLVNNWTGKRLFRADTATANPPASGEFYPAQAFYGGPNASYDEQGNLWVYVGTGDRNHPNNTSSNRFYGIKDNTTMANGSPLTEANLTDITSTTTSVSQGWYVRLSSNEKVLAQSDVFNKVVFFSSFTPTTTTSCGSGGGTAKLYAIQMTSGYAAVDWSTNQPYTTSSASNTRGKIIGTGIPSKPIVIITDSGTTLTTSVIAATTSQQLPSNPAPPPGAMRTILYWREIF
jgi:type IV pilus assembly protein PilY1